MSYLARQAAALTDLALGMEILYFPGDEYIPARAVHGIITSLMEIQGSVQAPFIPVRLDSMALPVRIFASRACWIIGS